MFWYLFFTCLTIILVLIFIFIYFLIFYEKKDSFTSIVNNEVNNDSTETKFSKKGLNFILHSFFQKINPAKISDIEKLICTKDFSQKYDPNKPLMINVETQIVIKVYSEQLYKKIPYLFEISLDNKDNWFPIKVYYSYFNKNDRFIMQNIDDADADQYASYLSIDLTKYVKNSNEFYIRGENIDNVCYISIQIIGLLDIYQEVNLKKNEICNLRELQFFTNFTTDGDYQFFKGTKEVDNPFRNENSLYSIQNMDVLLSENPNYYHSKYINVVDNSAIPVLRLSKLLSETDFILEQANLNTCSDSYLFSRPVDNDIDSTMDSFQASEISKNYGIMRIKVPHVLNSDQKIYLQRQYDLLYFSVSSMQDGKKGNIGTFWTVNVPMMERLMDANGYSFIFWMPQEEFVGRFQLDNTEPPIIQWGDYQGYVLPTPTIAFYFRYKASNPYWKGAPANAPCYFNADTNKPITTEYLGEWLPSLYGDNFTNFTDFINSSSIGLVSDNKTLPWPISY